MTQDTGGKEAANKFLVLFNNCKITISGVQSQTE
mgnify:CR=1 FL=1